MLCRWISVNSNIKLYNSIEFEIIIEYKQGLRDRLGDTCVKLLEVKIRPILLVIYYICIIPITHRTEEYYNLVKENIFNKYEEAFQIKNSNAFIIIQYQ